MAYSYKGSISFGLVYIPITLHNCVKNNDIGFNMLDKKTMSRVQYKKTCADCEGRELNKEDIVKGYEYEKDRYVVFEDSDFEKIKTKKDRNITIQEFVDISEIDPLYYDKPYYVSPTGAERAYALLIKAMSEQNKVGIAKTVLGSKETLIAIRVRDGQMLLNTLYFNEEIQKNPAKDVSDVLDEKEVKLAVAIIDNMSSHFQIEKYKDEYRERVQSAIEQKIAGREIISPVEKRENRIIDLMEALENSLKSTNKTSKNNNANAIIADFKTEKKGADNKKSVSVKEKTEANIKASKADNKKQDEKTKLKKAQ